MFNTAKWQVVRAIAILLAGALFASASAQANEPTRGGTLEFAVVGWPSTLDCHGATSYAVLHYVSPHYSLLVKFDQDRYPEVKGDVAESWQVSPDGLTYTFKLRPNIVFHNGTPLTSADVKASFDRLISPPPGVISAS